MYDGIEFGHDPCLGLRVGGIRNGQESCHRGGSAGGGGYEVLECSGKGTEMGGLGTKEA